MLPRRTRLRAVELLANGAFRALQEASRRVTFSPMSTPEQKCIGSPEPMSERRSEAFAQANRAFSKAALTLSRCSGRCGGRVATRSARAGIPGGADQARCRPVRAQLCDVPRRAHA